MRWLRRILLLLLTVYFSMTLTFIIIRSMPGDPVQTLAMEIMRNQSLDYEVAYERAKAMLNFDPDIPLGEQYIKYIKGITSGNLGTSIAYRQPVVEVIFSALPWTLLVLTISLGLSFLIGIILGMYIAWKRKTLIDPIVTVYASIFGSIPNYVVAYILVVIFSVTLHWLPPRGPYDSSMTPGWNIPFISSVIKHSILPVMAYFLTGVGGWILNMKGNAVSVLGEDYITMAKARGLPDKVIITKYVGKNAILPLVTSLAITFGFMFGGSPLIENIFVYPGVGFFLGRAIASRDYPLMQGMFLMITIAVVTASLLAEMLYSVLDPRIRERG